MLPFDWFGKDQSIYYSWFFHQPVWNERNNPFHLRRTTLKHYLLYKQLQYLHQSMPHSLPSLRSLFSLILLVLSVFIPWLNAFIFYYGWKLVNFLLLIFYIKSTVKVSLVLSFLAYLRVMSPAIFFLIEKAHNFNTMPPKKNRKVVAEKDDEKKKGKDVYSEEVLDEESENDDTNNEDLGKGKRKRRVSKVYEVRAFFLFLGWYFFWLWYVNW